LKISTQPYQSASLQKNLPALILPMPIPFIPIIIIGGGPIGLACGLEARKAGIQYLIFEKGPLVNSLYNYQANMTFFSTSERL
jgi:thioredoxin reductase (NADPH)